MRRMLFVIIALILNTPIVLLADFPCDCATIEAEDDLTVVEARNRNELVTSLKLRNSCSAQVTVYSSEWAWYSSSTGGGNASWWEFVPGASYSMVAGAGHTINIGEVRFHNTIDKPAGTYCWRIAWTLWSPNDTGDDCLSTTDYFCIEIEASSIGEVDKPQEIFLKTSPNPFNSACRVFSPEGSEVQIFDIQGHLIDAIPSGNTIWKPTDTIANGLYLVRATSNGNTQTKKVCLIRQVNMRRMFLIFLIAILSVCHAQMYQHFCGDINVFHNVENGVNLGPFHDLTFDYNMIIVVVAEQADRESSPNKIRVFMKPYLANPTIEGDEEIEDLGYEYGNAGVSHGSWSSYSIEMDYYIRKPDDSYLVSPGTNFDFGFAGEMDREFAESFDYGEYEIGFA